MKDQVLAHTLGRLGMDRPNGRPWQAAEEPLRSSFYPLPAYPLPAPIGQALKLPGEGFRPSARFVFFPQPV